MRQSRKLVKGATYLVTAKANHLEPRLDLLGVKKLLLKTISDAKGKYSFQVTRIQIMADRLELIIVPENDSSLSFIMKWILGVFAVRYNKRFKLWGHFWGDRFISRIIEPLKEVLRYPPRQAAVAFLQAVKFERFGFLGGFSSIGTIIPHPK